MNSLIEESESDEEYIDDEFVYQLAEKKKLREKIEFLKKDFDKKELEYYILLNRVLLFLLDGAIEDILYAIE